MSNKYFNRLKENGFYLLLLVSIVVITLVLTIISFNDKPNVADEDIDLNEQYVEDNTIIIPEEPKILEDDPEINMEEVTNVVGNSELGDNFLIVKEDESNNNEKNSTKDNNDKDNVLNEDKEEDNNTTEEVKDTFIAYNNNKDMLWPVTGEVVMDFSMDHLIYDSTLNQYRTNDSLNIGCEIGTDVKVAADGIVEKVEKSDQLGNIIIVDHGNGWKTTYAQLSDEVYVEENERVNKGEVIGQVSSPTKYFAELGSHLNFKILKGDGPINPLDHLTH